VSNTKPGDIEIVDQEHGMVARRVVVGALDTNCWILFHPDDRRATIVDPGDEPTRILDACADVTPTSVVLTHQHSMWPTPTVSTCSHIPTMHWSGRTKSAI